MLLVTIESSLPPRQYLHRSGVLVLGRDPGGEEPQIRIKDPYVSRRQVLVEQVSADKVRCRNVGRNDLEFPDGQRLAQDGETDLDLPTTVRIGQTVLAITPQGTAPLLALDPAVDPGDHELQALGLPATVAGSSDTWPSLASLGQAPPAEKLSVWFETLLSVQRSAAGSLDFFEETARALVDLVGLDRGLVLIRESSGWRIVGGWAKDHTVGLHFSRSVLSRVVEQGRTFYGSPQAGDVRTSLKHVEAVVSSPIFGAGGEVTGVLYGSRDWGPRMSRTGIQPLEAQVVQLLASSVSAGLARQEIQQRLQQAEQLAAVGQAIAYIVHDLRGPLGNAKQLLEMLRDGRQDSLPREEQMDLMDDSLRAASELLDDSLEFCRGTVRVDPVPGTFSGLLGKRMDLLELELQALGVALERDVPDGLQVELDPDRMLRVLRNLAKNAGEALQGRANAMVTIGARHRSEGVELYVADNGPGIPSVVLERLFQPFSTHGKRGGTGFGLAIARQLVEAHHGQITVASDASGTRFTITLPGNVPPLSGEREAASAGRAAAGESPSGSSPAGAPASAGEMYTVLLAEDGLVSQRLLVSVLRSSGHRVQTASNGREALDAWREGSFDVVLMDVEMPEMDGLAAAREIRRREQGHARRTPILGLTAHASEEVRDDCLAAGMDAILVKPVEKHTLRDALDRLATDSREAPVGGRLPLA